MGDTTDTELLEDMLRNAEKAKEPGEIVRVIQEGNESKDEPAIVAMPVTSAGYTVVYDRRTGIPSIINNNNLPYQLKKKRDNGTYVYGLKQLVTPEKGKHLCMLHKDAENRTHYDVLGFAICPKEGLASPYQVRRHMARTQKDEWRAIEDMMVELEKKEDRDFQRVLMEKVTGVTVEKAPLYVSDKDKKKK